MGGCCYGGGNTADWRTDGIQQHSLGTSHFVLTRALFFPPLSIKGITVDELRRGIEGLDTAQYENRSYYERWYGVSFIHFVS